MWIYEKKLQKPVKIAKTDPAMAKIIITQLGGPNGETGAAIMEKYSGASLSILYSVLYNAVYMIPETILTTVAAFIIGAVPFITKQADFES